DAPPLPLPALAGSQRPLSGVRALDLTRVLAGPVAGRALAGLGADVMLVNGPHLPNIDAIADTSRGKRSALVDLRTDGGQDTLRRLVDGAHVFSQGYRPGGLAARGFSPEALAQRRPGIVCVSLTAYGTQGPWADRRGFDSLVQTAMGFNHAEGEAAGNGTPRALPMQILD
ncbi:CoA transferase, partial [Myxococcus llanfairpwllgwyngyllgogerychwyrndrobwllllantysiliogogogochensis]